MKSISLGAALLFASLPGFARAANTASLQNSFYVDGPVYALNTESSLGALIVGGSFSYAGPRTGGGGVVDGNVGGASDYGDAIGTAQYISGTVYAVVADGAGGWYVGGNFVSVGPYAYSNLVHFTNASTVEPGFFPNPDGPVYALALDGTRLYVGGSFSNIGFASRTNLAYILTGSGGAATWAPNPDGVVRAIALTPSATTVFIGGDFLNINSVAVARNHIAEISSLGGVTPWNPNASAAVRVLRISGTNVYAGGDFTSIGGQTRNRVAKLDAGGSTGWATTWNPNANNVVRDLVKIGTWVYAGGDFTSIGGQSLNCLARLDDNGTTGWAYASWAPNPNLYVNAMSYMGGSVLFVGGDFSTLGGQPREKAAAVDINTGALFSWQTRMQPFPSVYGLASTSIGFQLFVGGSFDSVGGRTRNNIAAFNNSTLRENWDPSTNGLVKAIAVNSNDVFIGGTFTQVSGIARNYLASVDANVLSNATLRSWNPNAQNRVNALVRDGGNLYAAGLFSNMNGTPRAALAAFNESSGTLLSWRCDANAEALALAASGGVVYAAGTFTQVSGSTHLRIAAADGATGIPVPGWTADASSQVNALFLDGSTLYAGGQFATVNSISHLGLAALTAATGAPTAWNPSVNTGSVSALYARLGTVYVGGSFTQVNSISQSNLAALDASGALTSWAPQPSGLVRALASDGSPDLAVGGDFTSILSVGLPYAAMIRDSLLFTPTVTPTPSRTPSFTFSPTRTATPSASPSRTASPTPTASPTRTASPLASATGTPTVSPTPAFKVSASGVPLLGPVPAPKGGKACVYLDKAFSSIKLGVYNSAGEKAAEFSFFSPPESCFELGNLAPGIYWVMLDLAYADGSSKQQWQKLVVAP